jgi:hypothetical protein
MSFFTVFDIIFVSYCANIEVVNTTNAIIDNDIFFIFFSDFSLLLKYIIENSTANQIVPARDGFF